MAFHESRLGNVTLNLPSRQYIPREQPQRTDLMGLLAQSTGQGLGQGIQQGISSIMQRNALQKALSMLGPESSPQDQIGAIASLDPQTQKSVLDFLDLQRKQTQGQAFSSALGNLLGGEPTSSGAGMSAISPQQLASLAPEQALKLADFSQKQKAQQFQEKKLAIQETRDYRKNILEGYQGAQETRARLDKMDKLNKTGKLSTPLMAATLEKAGIPLGALNNPDSEEFQKLSQDLLKGISSVFPGRILQSEIENFMRTIPTLENSKEGRDRIIKNMKLLLTPKELEYKALQQVMKETGGQVPLDLHERIAEKLEPQFEKFRQDFASSENTPSGYIKVTNPQTGESLYITEQDRQAAMAEGFQ